MTNSISEINGAELLFLIGTNTTEAHPVIGYKMKQAVRRGAKLIVVDPRRIELAEEADRLAAHPAGHRHSAAQRLDAHYHQRRPLR
jgi:predicted molibdopterin-dependent oxidoreductase YjgC